MQSYCLMILVAVNWALDSLLSPNLFLLLSLKHSGKSLVELVYPHIPNLYKHADIWGFICPVFFIYMSSNRRNRVRWSIDVGHKRRLDVKKQMTFIMISFVLYHYRTYHYQVEVLSPEFQELELAPCLDYPGLHLKPR